LPFVLSNGGGGRNLLRNYTVLSPKFVLFVSSLLTASSKKSNSLVRDVHPEIPTHRTLEALLEMVEEIVRANEAVILIGEEVEPCYSEDELLNMIAE
jgi:hypothetical protein